MTRQSATDLELEKTCVVVRAGATRYCIPVRRVREVVTNTRVTPVPGSPPEVPGVINVRGRVMALVDLRVALGLTDDPGAEAATALVLDADVAQDLAVRVDEVIDVQDLSAVEFQPPPSFGLGASASFASAVVDLQEVLGVVLDVEGFLASVGVGSTEESIPTAHSATVGPEDVPRGADR